MKDMFRFGDDGNQTFFEDILEYSRRNRVLEAMYRNNIDFYSNLFRDATSYYKQNARMLEKLMDTYSLPFRSGKARAGTFPANGHDIYNYIGRYNMSNLQIQAVMMLDGRLDFDKLKKAVRLSVDAEPVLKCRFVEDDPPYWKLLENISMVDFCSFEETHDIARAVEDFIQSPLDIDKDPMVKVRLIRSEQYDVLGLKISHVCCDGAGVQEYMQLLADIYSKIDKEDTSYIPVPRIAGRKDQDRLFKELGITNPESLFIPGSDISIPMWPFPWEKSTSNTACMVVKRFPSGYADIMRRYAKSRQVTVNDLILTAFYRALLQMGEPIYGLPLEIPITVDLRRYLPDHKTKAIRNFSGSVNTRLVMRMNESFNETLQRVANMMKEIKKGYPGLQSAIGLERIEKISYYDALSYYQVSPESRKTGAYCPLYSGDKCVPTLSNLGYISRSLIKFGDHTVTDAYILPPAIRAPGLLLMACSYNSVMTLAIGYYRHSVHWKNIEKLLDNMRNELIEVCKEQQAP